MGLIWVDQKLVCCHVFCDGTVVGGKLVADTRLVVAGESDSAVINKVDAVSVLLVFAKCMD